MKLTGVCMVGNRGAAVLVGGSFRFCAAAASDSTTTTSTTTVVYTQPTTTVVVVGTPVATLPCSATVISAGGVTYYRCGTTYYTQGYSGGSVVYVQTQAPAGY